jgi:hypothetical protein
MLMGKLMAEPRWWPVAEALARNQRQWPVEAVPLTYSAALALARTPHFPVVVSMIRWDETDAGLELTTAIADTVYSGGGGCGPTVTANMVMEWVEHYEWRPPASFFADLIATIDVQEWLLGLHPRLITLAERGKLQADARAKIVWMCNKRHYPYDAIFPPAPASPKAAQKKKKRPWSPPIKPRRMDLHWKQQQQVKSIKV